MPPAIRRMRAAIAVSGYSAHARMFKVPLETDRVQATSGFQAGVRGGSDKSLLHNTLRF